MQEKCITVTFEENCSYKDIAIKISNQLESSWIFIHTKLLEKLMKDKEANLCVVDKKTHVFLLWQPTEEMDLVGLKLNNSSFEEPVGAATWKQVMTLNNIDKVCDNPKEILFFKLEE